MEHYEAGNQVVYIPNHATNINDKDVQFGFVTSSSDKFVFCRFWLTDENHNPINELRTKSCSEPCYRENIVKHESVPSVWITNIFKRLDLERIQNS